MSNRYYEGNSLVHLGDTHAAAGDHEAARRTWERALAVLAELGHPDAEQVRTRLAELSAAAVAS